MQDSVSQVLKLSLWFTKLNEKGKKINAGLK